MKVCGEVRLQDGWMVIKKVTTDVEKQEILFQRSERSQEGLGLGLGS